MEPFTSRLESPSIDLLRLFTDDKIHTRCLEKKKKTETKEERKFLKIVVIMAMPF